MNGKTLTAKATKTLQDWETTQKNSKHSTASHSRLNHDPLRRLEPPRSHLMYPCMKAKNLLRSTGSKIPSHKRCVVASGPSELPPRSFWRTTCKTPNGNAAMSLLAHYKITSLFTIHHNSRWPFIDLATMIRLALRRCLCQPKPFGNRVLYFGVIECTGRGIATSW